VSIFPLFPRLGLLLLMGLSGWPTAASADDPLGQNGAMTSYGLMPADHFITTSGACADCGALPQALWYFRAETIAVPAPGAPVAGFARGLPVAEDLARWAGGYSPGVPMAYPPLVWIGSPLVERHAAIDISATTLRTGAGRLALRLTPRLPLNKSWFDVSSAAFFHGRPVKVRGTREDGAFVARTLWPEDFLLPAEPPAEPRIASASTIRDWVRAQPQGGARSPFAVESVWRRAGAPAPRSGQPLIGLMLNGAQGDDDEAHGGHFALITGRVGTDGAMDDWLVNNFYSLDSESEKGIIAAPVPLDNYLGDLNSGQGWYRPSYMLVATLREERAATHIQSALGRVYNQFYRHQFAYEHAGANCAGISVTTLRALGWQVPARGPESWLKAIPALPLVAVKERSLKNGKAVFDYLTEDRTKLYPAAAFEEIAADLMNLAAGSTGRPLNHLERILAEDLEEILLVRVPQFPSSRAWGDWPVESSTEYQARVPADPALQQIIPVPPRPFPEELRDPQTPREPPLRSEIAVLAWGVALLGGLLLILRRLLA